jgi:DNA-binding NtrC family response regulator
VANGFSPPGGTIKVDARGRPPRGTRALRALAYMGCAEAPDPDAARLVWLDPIDRIVIGRAAELAFDKVGARVIEARLPDRLVSGSHGTIERHAGKWRLRDPGSSNGTRVGGRPVADYLLRPGDIIETGSTFWRYLEHQPLQPAFFPKDRFAQLGPTRTVCPALIGSLALLGLAAKGKGHVLILGETGSGKEVLTDHIHALSGRKGRCVKVNCASFSPERAGGELFGWVKGAFTGADRDKEGCIEAAHEGTLFLDEIGTLSLAVQAMLLRVVEDGVVVRLGDRRERHVDLRIVSATNADLPAMLKAGTFRDDLYARLAWDIARLPPLRERLEDLCTLVAHHLRAVGAPGVDPAAMRGLLLRDWPSNIRDLYKALDGAVRLSEGAVLQPEHFNMTVPEDTTHSGEPARDEAQEAERARLAGLLRECGGNVRAVARAMGIHPNLVYRAMERLGLDADDYRPGSRPL